MFNDTINLIKETDESDRYGDSTPKKIAREVFAKIKSVGMKEKYEALAVGLQPELVFILPDYYEYDDESLIEYEGKIYDVIRTYRTGRQLEVVVSRGRSQQC